LAGDRLVTVQRRTPFNLFLGQVHGKVLLGFDRGDQRMRRNQHLPARKPGAGVGDQIADGPMPVIEVEFFDLPDFPVEAVQFVTLQCFGLD
jgi:hypothetical protein